MLQGEARKESGLTARDYSYGYWRNAYRRVQGDTSPDALCLESGAYGFMAEPKNLSRPRCGVFETRLDYQQVLEAGNYGRKVEIVKPGIFL